MRDARGMYDSTGPGRVPRWGVAETTKPPRTRGLLSWNSLGKKERCHKSVKALGYLSMSGPVLSIFRA